MANKPLQSIQFHGLPDKYTVPQMDSNFDGVSGKIPDSKKVHDEIDSLKEDLNAIDGRVTAIETGGGGVTNALKSALLQIAQKVAYIDEDGQDYYDDLYDALYPPATLISISAVYTQSGTVYDIDTLDSLKSDLVVTGYYSDASTRAITGYTLSGTLAEGTSTITVTYEEKTTTFTVVVSESVNVPVYYKGVSILGNAPGTSDGSVKTTSNAVNFDSFISAVFEAGAEQYKVVDRGSHNRFRFYGLIDDVNVETNDFAGKTVYRIADTSTVSGIDALSEYTIDNSVTQYKVIFVYLWGSSPVGTPDLVVTPV